MALLHYENLGVPQPINLLKNAFFGLSTFFSFLKTTVKQLENAVRRVAFKPGVDPEGGNASAASGVWVQLDDLPGRPDESEAAFRAFMEDDVREVFELLDEKAPLRFAQGNRIAVFDRDPETAQLLLERLPKGRLLALRPNTLTLERQLEALKRLQNAPSSSHLPLLRLVEPTNSASWPTFEPAPVSEWLVLADEAREGTNEQRAFVRLALATPDFAFLEGPPGSGKTTAICELILQLAQQGKRVLLCASTHVAVDNVLERLMDERNQHRDLVIPVRIGEKRKVSENARRWQLEHFVNEERERLLKKLGEQRNLSESQLALREALRTGSTAIERMVLDGANLVCGTLIGILQHPDIKSGTANAEFDVLIVDEASKTTFQEFLVPAMFAKRWVIVGDPKQLSPYVDDDGLAANVEVCLPKAEVRNACIDVFNARTTDPHKQRVAAVVTESAAARSAYLAQAAARDVVIADAAAANDFSTASLVVGDLQNMQRREQELPLDLAVIRAPAGSLQLARRRADAWLQQQHQDRKEQTTWESEIAWRLTRHYEQRFARRAAADTQRTTSERMRREIDALLPASGTGAETEQVWGEIDRVRRVALPSVLESLRYGFERDAKARNGTALSDGLPSNVLSARHVLLSTQHRMHPDIAALSHQHVYDGQALVTPARMTREREWSFARHAHRQVWIDVRNGFISRNNSNPKEAAVVLDELKAFEKWAERNARPDGRPWEAAVLSFYRGQERELRSHLRRWTRQNQMMARFTYGSRQRPHLVIELCTVDRFQGHEADLVIISFAKEHSTSFLESPNRLNVALTRARYQRVIVGNRTRIQASRGDLLRTLAESSKWDHTDGAQS